MFRITLSVYFCLDVIFKDIKKTLRHWPQAKCKLLSQTPGEKKRSFPLTALHRILLFEL